ncbi:hypothetical protein GQ42DRAFT_160638 [Ramicandelaber brevisporus]|nr:hypothetical protein GQ42DRAFT_160638 [Ramicandelaber brevisporus]
MSAVAHLGPVSWRLVSANVEAEAEAALASRDASFNTDSPDLTWTTPPTSDHADDMIDFNAPAVAASAIGTNTTTTTTATTTTSTSNTRMTSIMDMDLVYPASPIGATHGIARQGRSILNDVASLRRPRTPPEMSQLDEDDGHAPPPDYEEALSMSLREMETRGDDDDGDGEDDDDDDDDDDEEGGNLPISSVPGPPLVVVTSDSRGTSTSHAQPLSPTGTAFNRAPYPVTPDNGQAIAGFTPLTAADIYQRNRAISQPGPLPSVPLVFSQPEAQRQESRSQSFVDNTAAVNITTEPPSASSDSTLGRPRPSISSESSRPSPISPRGSSLDEPDMVFAPHPTFPGPTPRAGKRLYILRKSNKGNDMVEIEAEIKIGQSTKRVIVYDECRLIRHGGGYRRVLRASQRIDRLVKPEPHPQHTGDVLWQVKLDLSTKPMSYVFYCRTVHAPLYFPPPPLPAPASLDRSGTVRSVVRSPTVASQSRRNGSFVASSIVEEDDSSDDDNGIQNTPIHVSSPAQSQRPQQQQQQPEQQQPQQEEAEPYDPRRVRVFVHHGNTTNLFKFAFEGRRYEWKATSFATIRAKIICTDTESQKEVALFEPGGGFMSNKYGEVSVDLASANPDLERFLVFSARVLAIEDDNSRQARSG